MFAKSQKNIAFLCLWVLTKYWS